MKAFRTFSLVAVLLLVATTAMAAEPTANFNPGTGSADVAVMNTTNDNASVTAEWVNPTGTTERTSTKTLAGKGAVDFLASESGLGDGWSGSMVLSSTAEIASVARVTWSGGSYGDGKVSGTYSGVPQGSTTVYCPSVFQRQTAQYSVLTVQNTDTGAVTVDMYYYDRNGNAFNGGAPLTDTIPQNAQRTYDLGTPGGLSPSLGVSTPPGDGWIGSMKAVARDGKKIAVVATTHWTTYSSIDNCAASGSTTLYFPDVKRRVFGGVWAQFGGVVAQNLSNTTAANITATWTDRDGNVLHTFNTSIPANSSKGFNTRFAADTPDPDALWNALGTDRNGAVRITSSQPLAGVYNGQTVSGGDQAGTYAGDSAGGTSLFFPAVYRTVSSGIFLKFSAVLVYNPNDAPASVTVRFYQPNGTLAYQFNDSIPAKSSHGYNTQFAANTPDANALFAALGSNYRGGVHVTSNVPVLGTGNTIEGSVDTDSYNAYAQ